MLVVLLAGLGLTSVAFAPPARAATQQVTMLSPVSGSVTSVPQDHHICCGAYGEPWGDWSEDVAAGGGTAVHARVSGSGSTPGLTVANAVFTKVGSDRTINVYNSAGTTHVIVDLLGWIP